MANAPSSPQNLWTEIISLETNMNWSGGMTGQKCTQDKMLQPKDNTPLYET